MTNDQRPDSEPRDPASLSDLLLKFFEQLKVYVNLRIEYFKLHVAEYLIRFFSSFALYIILFWILFFATFFASFAFAYWYGEKTGHWSTGFLIVTGFYILAAVLVYVFRRILIIRPFTRLILEQMDFNQTKDQENEKEEQRIS
jgi:hypothetical protein